MKYRGVHPGEAAQALEAAGDGAEEEGVQIALELIEAVKKQAGRQRHPPDGGGLGRDRAPDCHRSRIAASRFCCT